MKVYAFVVAKIMVCEGWHMLAKRANHEILKSLFDFDGAQLYHP